MAKDGEREGISILIYYHANVKCTTAKGEEGVVDNERTNVDVLMCVLGFGICV